MKNCTKCNHDFKFFDKLRDYFKGEGHIKCPKCKSAYKPKSSIYKVIYYLAVILIYTIIFKKIAFKNFVAEILIIAGTLFLFDLLPHRYHKYIKVD